jgi:carbamoylphosphate synthase large subunit
MDLVKNVVEKLGIVGPACTQVIIEEETNDPYLIECNARFGGGTVLSIYAGLDMIEMIKEEYPHNDSPNLTKHLAWRSGQKMRRFFSEYYI